MGKYNKNKKLSSMYYQSICPQRQLPIKEHETEYAIVEKNFGQLHYAVACSDGKMRLAILRGRLRNKVYINEGDIILVGLRDYQDDKCDIMLKFHNHEIRQLWQQKEIPDQFYNKIKLIFPYQYSDISTESCVNDSDIVFLDDDEVEQLKLRNISMLSSLTQQSYSFVGDQSERVISDFDTLSINTQDLQVDQRSEAASDFEVMEI